MRTSVYTLVGMNDTLKDVIKLSKEIGYDAIDIRMCDDGIHILPEIKEEDVKNIKKLCEDTEIEISGLTSYYKIGLTDRNERDKTLDKIKKAMEIVNLLGAKFLRVSASDIDFKTGYEKQREIFREDCLLVSDIARKVKVVVTIEQHSLSMAASAGQILDLMRGIDNSHIGIVYDPGNTVFEGYERVNVQIEMLKHLIKNVHLKNCIIKGGTFTEEGWLPSEVTKIDKGVLNWKEIILNLKKNGYDGFLTLEDFSEANWALRERLEYNYRYIKSLI